MRLGVGSSINGNMPVGLSSLVGDRLLGDTNPDVYEKTAAKGSDVNAWVHRLSNS